MDAEQLAERLRLQGVSVTPAYVLRVAELYDTRIVMYGNHADIPLELAKRRLQTMFPDGKYSLAFLQRKNGRENGKQPHSPAKWYTMDLHPAYAAEIIAAIAANGLDALYSEVLVGIDSDGNMTEYDLDGNLV